MLQQSLPSEKQAGHLPAAIGRSDLFKSKSCLSYHDRFYPVTDEALGITYRDGVSSQVSGSIQVDSLYGPIKPKDYSETQWTEHLQERNKIINSRTDQNFPDWKALSQKCGIIEEGSPEPKKRTAIANRFYEGYVLVSQRQQRRVYDIQVMISRLSPD